MSDFIGNFLFCIFLFLFLCFSVFCNRNHGRFLWQFLAIMWLNHKKLIQFIVLRECGNSKSWNMRVVFASDMLLFGCFCFPRCWIRFAKEWLFLPCWITFCREAHHCPTSTAHRLYFFFFLQWNVLPVGL